MRTKQDLSLILTQYIKDTFDIDSEVICFNSEEKNIDDLGLLFASAPKKLIFVFIKGSLRAGKRLAKDHIVGVLDTEKVKSSASVIQSLLGRLTGYDVNNRGFNIFCDESHVERCIQYWNDVISNSSLPSIPSSSYNNTNVKEDKSKYNISWHSTAAAALFRAKQIGINTEMKGFATNGGKVSDNIKINFCEFAIESKNPGGGGNTHFYLLDKPANSDKFDGQDSWDKLIEKVGKDKIEQYMLFEPCAEKIISRLTTAPNISFVLDKRTLSDVKDNPSIVLSDEQITDITIDTENIVHSMKAHSDIDQIVVEKSSDQKYSEIFTQLDAAEEVLKINGKPMTNNEIHEEITKRHLWSPPKGGKTPELTLSAQLHSDGRNRFVNVSGQQCLAIWSLNDWITKQE